MTEVKKLYHSISEVSERLDVKPHVLRYWETQFRWLRPRKNRAGNRSYQEKDLILLEQIRDLLYVRRFTIEGARKELERRKAAGSFVDPETADSEVPTGTPESSSPTAERGSSTIASSRPPTSATSSGMPPARVAETPAPSGGATTPNAVAGAPRSPGPAVRAEIRAVRQELEGLKAWLESRP